MRGITPIIAIIILLFIAIALAGAAWTYMFGYYGTLVTKQIKTVLGSEYGNSVMIMNIGEGAIEPGELRVEVDGQPALVVDPQRIEPMSSAVIKFLGSVGENQKVRIIGPGNVVEFRTSTEKGDVVDVAVDSFDSVLAMTFDSEGAEDVSGNGNEGTVEGATYNPTGGQDGLGAYEFDGISNRIINQSDFSGFNLNESLTISAWVSPEMLGGVGVAQNIISLGGGYPFNFYLYNRNGVGYVIELHLQNEVPADFWWYSDGSVPYTIDEWQHFAVTWANTEQPTFYRNGVALTTTGYGTNSNGMISDYGKSFTIGTQFLSNYFNGIIDDVMVFNYTLSAEEVQALYDSMVA